ncbi:MAG: chemotaxis-specific protein-glutamate methyltransferase CheB [Rhodobacteraceae bacterium]|nr:chemotaxis-specific protein-glutamate methyltransferase CheB [Paracoccaceae bacterium]
MQISGRPARVLIVDDSRTIRAMLRTVIDTDPRLEVIGEATDPYAAREAIKRLNPDVITLDVEMPRMNGLVFLEHLMRLRPTPTIMVSNRAQENSDVAIKALSLGAIDCIDLKRFMHDPSMYAGLIQTLLTAANARVGPPKPHDAERSGRSAKPSQFAWNGKFVLIGSSTGGVEALSQILKEFPSGCPPTVVAQHMPRAFLESFCRRLENSVAPTVRSGDEDLPLRQGEILFAPGGDHHLELEKSGAGVRPVREDESALYVPSVDRLFHSAVPTAKKCVAVLLTGMGRDGADGMAALRSAGARTLAQSGDTCVVDGMPRAARQSGAVERSVDLADMAQAILDSTTGSIAARRREVAP